MMITRTALLSPIEPTKATDQVVHRVAEMICSGVLKPGDQLPVEAELAAQLNVAQMTLRQALSILRDLGCIETVRGRNGGSFISNRPYSLSKIFVGKTPTLEELRDMTDYRMAIENEVTALAAIRAEKSDIQKIQEQLNKCVAGSNAGIDHWMEDNTFHICIAEASHSSKLVRACSAIVLEMTDFFERLTWPFEPILPHCDEHIELVAAIESGNPDRAWKASNKHLFSTHNFLEGIIHKLSQ